MGPGKMLAMSWCHFLLLITIVGTFLSGCAAVQIKRLVVPPLVELGGQESVVLDCEYTLKNSSGLVIKWFFKEKSNPVYQWIPPLKPQDMGIFKGKLDLEYKASQDPLQSHRALKILKPGANMSGVYSCVVSTYLDEDDKSKTMLVFTPGKNFQLRQEKKDADSVKLVCFAENVFPQPTISIISQSKAIKDVKTEVSAGAEGLFDVIGSVVVRDDDLADPEEFVCEMRVPQANYSARKQTIYYPGSGGSEIKSRNRFQYVLFTLVTAMLGYFILHIE